MLIVTSTLFWSYGVLDQANRDVKTILKLGWLKFCQISITRHTRIVRRGVGRARILAALAFANHCKREMANSCRKQQIVRQYPKPVSYIERRKESRKASGQVEIGEGIVCEFRQPDLSC